MRHIVMLLDIDDTLSIFKKYQFPNVRWTGSLKTWQKGLAFLQKELLKANIKLHIGICTAKKKYREPANALADMRGDVISASVTGDPHWQHVFASTENYHANTAKFLGLHQLINKKLIYFVGDEYDRLCCIYKINNSTKNFAEMFQVKAQALLTASNEIAFQEKVKTKDVEAWLVDDDVNFCQQAIEKNFNAIHFDRLFTWTRRQQRESIKFLFSSLLPNIMATARKKERAFVSMNKPLPPQLNIQASKKDAIETDEEQQHKQNRKLVVSTLSRSSSYSGFFSRPASVKNISPLEMPLNKKQKI